MSYYDDENKIIERKTLLIFISLIASIFVVFIATISYFIGMSFLIVIATVFGILLGIVAVIFLIAALIFKVLEGFLL